MDKTDVVLSLLLLANSRTPYSELANKLGLSVNAVHKRIKSLVETGIIRTFTAKVSLFYLKALNVIVFGRSEARSIDEACKKLGENDSTYWVAVASGNYLYVGAYLVNISELEPYVAFVGKEAQITDPTVGIIQFDSWFPPSSSTSISATLKPLDYQIISALQKNSRKNIPEVAKELGISAKTVRRRLSKMISDGSIDLSIEWYPDASNDIMTMFHLGLKASVDKRKAGALLANKYSPNLIFFWIFGNLPNLLVCLFWTTTMKELQTIRENLQREGIFESINPIILNTGYIFETWRDKIVIERSGIPHRKVPR